MEKIISVKNVCFELTPGNTMGLLGTNGAALDPQVFIKN